MTGKQKFYGLMLVLLLVLLVLLNIFYPSSNVNSLGSDLQPIRKYISNTTELPIEIYAGTISKISPNGITLSSGTKSKDFIISGQHPAKFIEANGKPIEPKVGDKAVSLFLVELPSKEKYVTQVVINASSRK